VSRLSRDPLYRIGCADAPEAFCDVWAFIPTHLFCPPIPSELLGKAVVIPGNGSGSDRESGVQVTFKLLSVDPANYDDAPSEGIRRLLQIATRQHIPKGQVYDTSIIGE
jgi:5-oxoprolinase (ATP-hydrolysing)